MEFSGTRATKRKGIEKKFLSLSVKCSRMNVKCTGLALWRRWMPLRGAQLAFRNRFIQIFDPATFLRNAAIALWSKSRKNWAAAREKFFTTMLLWSTSTPLFFGSMRLRSASTFLWSPSMHWFSSLIQMGSTSMQSKTAAIHIVSHFSTDVLSNPTDVLSNVQRVGYFHFH